MVTMKQKIRSNRTADKGESVKLISDELDVEITIVKDWRRNPFKIIAHNF